MSKHIDILKKASDDLKNDAKLIKDKSLKTLAKTNAKLIEQLINQFKFYQSKHKSI